MTAAELQAAAEKLDALAGKVEGLIRWVSPAVEAALDNPLMPDELKNAARYAASAFVKQARTGLAEINKCQTTAALLVHSDVKELCAGWGMIGTDAENLAEEMGTVVAVRDHWHGPAFDKYMGNRDKQIKAVGRVASIGKAASAILDEAADAELEVMMKIVAAAAIFVIAMNSALGMIAVVVTADKGLATAAGAIVVFLAMLAQSLLVFGSKMTTLAEKLKTETEGQTDFGTGLWPQGATKDFRQATPEDPPDQTPVEDWEPNRK